VAEQIVAEYLAPIRAKGVDTLILGCTHYPLLRDVVGHYMGHGVTLVDVGAQCARWVAGQLERDSLRAPSGKEGRHRSFFHHRTEDFAALASIFLEEDVSAGVEQIDITSF